MFRRRYLATLGLVGLAGCTGSSPYTDDLTDTPPPTDANSAPTRTSTSAPTAPPTEQCNTPSDTSTATRTPRQDVVLSVGEAELVTANLGFRSSPAGQATVTNSGNAPSSSVQCTFDWLDSDGEFLDSDSARCATIGPGETWVARARPLTTDEAQIAGVEAAISGAEEPAAIDSEGVSLVDSQLRASEENVLVRGEVRNTSESELRYVQATAKVYDGDEQLLTTAYTNETNLAARATWRFEIEPRTVGRNSDVESADVLLTTSTF